MARKGIVTSMPGIPQIIAPDDQSENDNKGVDANIVSDDIGRKNVIFKKVNNKSKDHNTECIIRLNHLLKGQKSAPPFPR